MNARQKQLSEELRLAGASDKEIRELLPIAANLQMLKEPNLPAFSPPGRWLRIFKPALIIVPSIVAGMIAVVVSQTVLPTSWLYPVQKLSDSVASSVDPNYKAQVMMKRAQQVNQLVARKADSRIILATLASYSANARSYKTQSHTSYAAFEYCKSNLQQAADKAPPTVRKAINTSLQSLEI